MLDINPQSTVYLYSGVCDMRKGFDRLAELAKEVSTHSVLSGGLFVFLNRKRTHVKILYWDNDGYALWYKRLEVGTFKVQVEDGIEKLEGVNLKMLLEGLDLSRIKMRQKVSNGMYV